MIKGTYTKYRLINYTDVWGNEVDGYEVNNQCVEFDDLIILDDASENDIIKYLVEIGFLSKEAERKVMITGDFDMMEVISIKDDYPLCRLERKF